jgi:hypothetical protein
VVSIQGVPLRMLRDCPDWVSQYQKARKTKHRRLRASGLRVESDSEEDDVESEDDDTPPLIHKKKSSGRPSSPVQASSKSSNYHVLTKEEARILTEYRSKRKTTSTQDVRTVSKVKSSASQHSKKRAREDSEDEDNQDTRRREKMVGHHVSRVHHGKVLKKRKDFEGHSRAETEGRSKTTHQHADHDDDARPVKRHRGDAKKAMVSQKSHKSYEQPIAGPSRLARSAPADEYEYVSSDNELEDGEESQTESDDE